MRVGYTINLGDCESMRIDTSDCETLKDCLSEAKDLLTVHSHIPEVQKFIEHLDLWEVK